MTVSIVFLVIGALLTLCGLLGSAVLPFVGTMQNLYLFSGVIVLFVTVYLMIFSRANLEVQHIMSLTIRYVVLISVGVLMVYPLLWMISATFKDNNEIFSSLSLIPQRFTTDGYVQAMNNYGGDINIWSSMVNTYKYVIPKVLFTVFSSIITAYGFGRFRFRGRNFLFAVLMATLFLPQVVLNIPQYMMYSKFGWVDNPFYIAIVIPTLFAQETYFVYMMIQFMRGIPHDLDEAAKIDGCNS